MLKGKKVSLHAVEREDLQQLRDWRNNPDFRKYFREYRELNMQQQEQWFEKSVVDDNNTQMFVIRKKEDNEDNKDNEDNIDNSINIDLSFVQPCKHGEQFALGERPVCWFIP